jgi:dihydrofolate reductase
MAIKYDGYLNVLFVSDLDRPRGAWSVFATSVEDVDAAYEDPRAKGVKSIRTPEDRHWGLRCAHFKDPGSNVREIHTPVAGNESGQTLLRGSGSRIRDGDGCDGPVPVEAGIIPGSRPGGRNGPRDHPKILRRKSMSDTSTGNGKVVVNRSMSLDGFIAGPGHAMDWVFDFVAPNEFPDIAAATGAMLIGRRTYEVGNRMDAGKERGSALSGETYPFSGPFFVLTHTPPEPPDPEVTFLTGDIGEAVATARGAADGKNLEILGADVAGQCLRRGLVDEILVYVLPVLLGDGIRFSSPGLARIDLEPVSSMRSGAVTILRFRVRK